MGYLQDKNCRQENKTEPEISHFSRNTGPKNPGRKKAPQAATQPVAADAWSSYVRAELPSMGLNPPSCTNQELSAVLIHLFLRMFGAEFCLQYTLASQLLIKTCCLRCATAPAIHLFPSLSSYSSHTVPCYRITDRFLLNMKVVAHCRKKNLCLYTNYSSAFLLTKSHFNPLSEIILHG